MAGTLFRFARGVADPRRRLTHIKVLPRSLTSSVGMDTRLIEKYDRRVPRYTSYPTAPHFDGSVTPATYERWLARLPAAMPLSIYLHVPFCDSLCWFCGCHTKIVRRYSPVAEYLEVLLREVELVAGRLGGRRPVSHLHWGGGSPTILNADDIRRLGGQLNRHFDVLPNAEFAVEIDPRGLEPEAIEALAAIGVTRASIGLQDINPQVQQAINRVQTLEETASAAGGLRAAGIKALNIDLMYGLPHQTVGRMEATVSAAVSMEPDRIALFGYAHVPALKPHQRLIPEEALPDGAERLAQSEAATSALLAAGYRSVGLDHFARPGDPLARAAEAGTLRRNFQGYTVDRAPALIGLGPSAIGALPDGYVQNAAPMHAYRDAIRSGRFAVHRGIVLSQEDRLRRAVIERLMCDMTVDLDALCSAFSVPPSRFAPELTRLGDLERDGLVVREGSVLTVPPDARPLLRCVAAVFDTYLDRAGGRHARAV